MIHLKSSIGIGFTPNLATEVLLDGNRLDLQSVKLAPDSQDYVIVQFIAPLNYPQNFKTRFTFVGHWKTGNQSIDVSMKVDVWYKGEGENLIIPDISDDNIIIKSGNQNIRLLDLFYEIPAGVIQDHDFVKIKLKRNNTTGEKLEIYAVIVELI